MTSTFIELLYRVELVCLVYYTTSKSFLTIGSNGGRSSFMVFHSISLSIQK